MNNFVCLHGIGMGIAQGEQAFGPNGPKTKGFLFS
jgi:hypothetical protein